MFKVFHGYLSVYIFFKIYFLAPLPEKLFFTKILVISHCQIPYSYI